MTEKIKSFFLVWVGDGEDKIKTVRMMVHKRNFLVR